MLACHSPISTLHANDETAAGVAGLQHCVRELSANELGRFEQHLLRLDEGSRRWRFCSPVPDAYIRAYVSGFNSANSVILGCFINGWLRGAVELRSPQPGWGAEGEIAFSVERSWQGRGIGTALMAGVMGAARARGVEHLYLTFSSINRPMRSIAEKVAANTDYFPDGECVANVNLPADGAAAA